MGALRSMNGLIFSISFEVIHLEELELGRAKMRRRLGTSDSVTILSGFGGVVQITLEAGILRQGGCWRERSF